VGSWIQERKTILLLVGVVGLLVGAGAPILTRAVGVVALAVGAAVVAALTFFGFQLAAATDESLSDRMRESITASVIVVYLVMLGWVAFFSPTVTDGKTLPALTTAFVDSYTKVVAAVVAFYFTVEGAAKVAGILANRSSQPEAQLGSAGTSKKTG